MRVILHAYRLRRLLVLWIGGVLLGSCGSDDPFQEALRLARGAELPVVGRLSTLTSHHLFSEEAARRCASADTGLTDSTLVTALKRAARSASQLAVGEASARLGVLHLIVCQYDDAVSQLEAAVAHAPSDAEAHNDLAVAYLTRSLALDRAFDRVQALGAVERAVELAPESEIVRFNHGMILDALHLRYRAEQAWQSFIKIATEPGSIQTAQTRLKKLRKVSWLTQWREAVRQLDLRPGPLNAIAIDRMTMTFPFRSRLYAEETLLPRWAQAWTEGDNETAGRSLSLARAIGSTLEGLHGEALLADTVRSVDRSLKAGDSSVAKLAEGFLAFRDGLASYNRQETDRAQPLLERASAALGEAGSPFTPWADFYFAICVYYQDANRALKLFRSLASKFETTHYTALLGRTHWLIGTIIGVQGNYQESIREYEAAFHLLRESSGIQGSAFVNVLLAEPYNVLGEAETAWRYRLEASKTLATSGDFRRIHSSLTTAVQALLLQERPRLADAFLTEAIENARRWLENPFALAESFAAEARVATALKDHARVQSAVRSARAALAEVEPNDLRAWLENWLMAIESVQAIDDTPERAVHLLTAAFAGHSEVGYEYERPHFLALRARALRRLGRLTEAKDDLESAIRQYEKIRRDTDDPAIKLSYFRQAQPAFDELISLQLDRHRSPGAAFITADRARSRFLLELRMQPRATDNLNGAPAEDLESRIRRSLGTDTVLVAYALLPGELVAWVLTRENRKLVRQSIQNDILEATVKKFRAELKRPGAQEQTLLDLASSLYESLISPLELPKAAEDLILIPDRFLAEIPFTALFDNESQTFLVEELAVSMMPSASYHVTGRAKAPRESARVLVVGEPDLGSSDFAYLGALDGADREARAVAAVHGSRSSLLLGREATKARFLQNLKNAGIVHFAGHAMANATFPQRSILLFSPASADDGTLRAEELWDERLDHLDLVVLSACGTMIGQAPGREALFGLAGSFLSAGARQVVATLWSISDLQGGEVMERFHQFYSQEQDAGRALQAAIVELLDKKNEGSRLPIASWAGFTALTGSP